MDAVSSAYILEHFSEAIEKGFVQAYYQPIYRTVTEKVCCLETLARWIDPDYGMLSPAEFIPVLERNGMILELDMEMLRQTCVFYKELFSRGIPIQAFSVNLSRHDLGHEDLFERVLKTLDTYDVPHEAIKLEITESLMFDDIQVFKKIISQFSDAGFSIWIDDFGSGYSSLNVLQNYSFDVMKFDMLFLQNFSSKSRKMLTSLINMAKSLGIHTLAEGVETKEQRDFLLDAGCEALQGYYYSRPVSREKLTSIAETQTESAEDRDYWNEIGHVNFLSPTPLDEFSFREEGDRRAEMGDRAPLALLEFSQNKAFYRFVNDSFFHNMQILGYADISDLEMAFNDRKRDSYLALKKMATDAISTNQIQEVDYVNQGVYYKVRAKCVARKADRAMLAVQLQTFESEREVKTAMEMLNYGNALFATYELVVQIFPERDRSTRIFTAQNLPVYDQAGSMLKSVQKFCQAQVDPADWERYQRFMDFTDMQERIRNSPKRFIQGYFRMKWGNGSWYTARVAEIPAFAEKMYLLTIQSIQGDGMQWLDTIAAEHPEMLI